VIPRSYPQWRHCIEVDCGIALKPDFITARLAALTGTADEPQRFARLYGEAHLRNVIAWFLLAQSELATPH
jgi:hypothetical protein